MNKPASELIALADCPFCGSSNISDRHVRDGRQMFCINCGASVAPTFHGPRGDTLDRAKEAWNTRTAANQSGSERAGVDALREALRNLRDANMSYSLVSNAKNARCLEQCMRDADTALATPPAQPAPAATHGKAVEAGQGVMKNGRYFNTGQTYNADGTLRYDFDAANSRDPWFNGDTFHGYDDEGCPIWNRTRS